MRRKVLILEADTICKGACLMEVFGNTGKLLRIDLSSSKIVSEKLDYGLLSRCLGGKCLGSKILFDEVMPGADPLGAGNELIFVSGPLQGTSVPGSGRFAVVFKSPLTGGYGESHGGGTFGPFMKMGGYDAIVVQGIAESPVFVEVSHDGEAVRDASDLWGKDVWETERALRRGRKRPVSIVCIGPAGERLVRFSAIMNDLDRAAARGGPGAVMGSKRLKAIVVEGGGKVHVAEEEKLRVSSREASKRIGSVPRMVSRRANGTSELIEPLNALGILPTRNFREGMFDCAEKIGSEAVGSILAGRKACFACPVGCCRRVEVKNGPFAPVHKEMGGPEYETLVSFGSLLLNDSVESIAKANEICNLNGIDTISAGVTIAYVMECCERGIIRSGGVDLKWGDAKAVLALLEQISSREGFGDILAEGVKRASERIGGGSEEFAMHVKGLELPLHEGRGKKGVGFLYAVGNAGSKHLEAEHDTSFERANAAPEIGVTEPISRFSLEGQADRIVKTQNLWALVDSLILCKFIAPIRAMTFAEMVEMTNQATGRNYTLEEMMLVGERAINLGRAFNVRENFSRDDDRLPARLFQPLERGPSAGSYFTEEEFNKGLDDFYRLRGWDLKRGWPTEAKLIELGLEDVAADLKLRRLLP